MIILKYFLFFIAALSLISCNKSISSNSSVSINEPKTEIDNTVESNQYAVYNAIIADDGLNPYIFDKSALLVIIERTNTDYFNNTRMLERVLTNVQKQLPSLSEATLNDFRANNKNRILLKDLFSSPSKRVFISDEELHNTLKDKLDWDSFYKKYPNSQGVLTLSNVGFDKEMKQAFVYIANLKGSNSGVGFYVLLEKQNDKWRIKEKFEAWLA